MLNAKRIGVIGWTDFTDRLRSGWVVACLAVWLGAIGMTSLFGLVQLGKVGIQGYERTVISLLNLVQYLVPLLGLLLGHDLIVSEREERTAALMVARGVNRATLLAGKFVGGLLTLTVPLLLGFTIAGTVIGLAAGNAGLEQFFRLAVSGLLLGVIFLGIGLLISVWSATRVRALVLSLLTWCIAVFVFDLVALALIVSLKAPAAAREIEIVCDTTHINGSTDIHQAFDQPAANRDSKTSTRNNTGSLRWLLINPVDLFRAVNLSKQTGLTVPSAPALAGFAGWLLLPFGLGLWKLYRLDL